MVAVIVFAVLLIVVSGIVLYQRRESRGVAKSYTANLTDLTNNVQDLQGHLGVPDSMDMLNKELDAYDTRLVRIEQPCKQLIQLKQPDKSDKGKAAGERIKGICEDLTAVGRYSQELHKQLRDYLLLPDNEWPKPASQEFNERLNTTTEVINKTRKNLEQLDNSKIQDPALDELLYQVKFAQDIAAKTKQAGDNHDEARKQAEELRIQLSRDKTDFLAARTYFWNNTIGIEQLLKALKGVQASLNEQSAPIRLQLDN